MGKDSPLTNTEVDANFTNLNDDKVEKSGDTLTGDLAFGDNVKAKFGDSDDLEIFHNGSKSFIKDNGTGALVLDTDGDSVRISHSNNAEEMARFTKNGSVLLKYDGADKLETTSSGVDVTGTVTADDSVLIEGGVAQLILNETDVSQGNSALINSGGQFSIRYRSDDGGTTTRRLAIDNNSGDISFYNTAGTSQALFWDASTERLGIGTTSPSYSLDVSSSSVLASRIQSSAGETILELDNIIN